MVGCFCVIICMINIIYDYYCLVLWFLFLCIKILFFDGVLFENEVNCKKKLIIKI